MAALAVTTITRREIHNNTPEQIHEYLKTAEEICKVQGYSPNDFPAVFVAVLGMVASKQIMLEQAPSVGVDLAALRGLPNGH